LSALNVLVILILFSSFMPVYSQPPGPPQFHYIAGSATYGTNGPFADGALVTVTDLNTSEVLTDIVGISGKSNQSGWYLVDLLELSQGYRHGDVVQITITGTNNFSDWQGHMTTTIDNTTFSQIVHVALSGHPPLKPTNIHPVPDAINISVNPTLKVHVVDPDGELMDVSFYDASTNSLIGKVSDILNNSNAQIVWFKLNYNTTYTWYVIANDSLLETTSDFWSFKTRAEPISFPPHPSFYWTPLSPSTNDTVHFMDFSTDDGSIISWKWEFGDGVTSYLKNPAHRYTDKGCYQVNLTVMDNNENVGTLSKSILVTNLPPHGNFTYISNGMTVTFMDMSSDIDGTIIDWYWEFGDGHSSIQQNPGHRYATPGIYSVYLCIVDDDGDQAHLTQEISVLQDSHLTVTITYPPAHEILNGTKILQGNTNSTVSIQRVDIKIDNGPWLEATGTTNWTYLWNTKEADNGNHILYARAYDGVIYSQIASVMTEIYNNHPSLLSITKPRENQTLKGKTAIQGWATDKDGNTTIQRVELRVDAGDWATALGTTVWLYELNTSVLPNGYHTLEVRAYDGTVYSESYYLVVKVDNRDTIYGFDKVFIFGGIASILAFVVALLVIVAILIRDKTKDKSHHNAKPPQKKKISKA
jgi:PKD repeat protein